MTVVARPSSPMRAKPWVPWLLALCLAVPWVDADARTGGGNDLVLAVEGSAVLRDAGHGRSALQALGSFAAAAWPDARLALVVFDERAHLLRSLTPAPALEDALPTVTLNALNANAAVGLERALYELETHGRADARRSVVIVTADGVNTGDHTLDRVMSRWMVEDLADEAVEAGIRVYGIGLTETADYRLLQTLAHKTGGEYFRAPTPDQTTVALSRIRHALNAPLSAAQEPARGDATAPTTSGPIAAPAAAPASGPANVTVTDAPGQSGIEPDAAPPAEATPPVATGQPVQATEVTPAVVPAPAVEPEAVATNSGAAGAPAPSASGRPDVDGAPAATTGEAPVSRWRIAWPDLTWIGDLEPQRTVAWLRGRGDVLAIAAAFAAALLVTIMVSLRMQRRATRPEPSSPRRLAPAPRGPAGAVAPGLVLIDCGRAGGGKGHEFSGTRVSVGRSGGVTGDRGTCLAIDADTVSREHAVIEFRDGDYRVRDCDSVNGTYVNDERVDGERQLTQGDRVRFGDRAFIVELRAGPRDRETAPPSATGTVALPASPVAGIAAAPAAAREDSGPDSGEQTLVRPPRRG